ncbi:MAG: hypothetical protein LBG98_03105 [Puniceicoccales bacterium]|jgi:hypothetical protein|nr:hypothetical protein [Puniceicoccales bacterium]
MFKFWINRKKLLKKTIKNTTGTAYNPSKCCNDVEELKGGKDEFLERCKKHKIEHTENLLPKIGKKKMQYFCLYVSVTKFDSPGPSPEGYVYLIAVHSKNKLEELKEAWKIHIFHEEQSFSEKTIEPEWLSLPTYRNYNSFSIFHHIVVIMAEKIQIEKMPQKMPLMKRPGIIYSEVIELDTYPLSFLEPKRLHLRFSLYDTSLLSFQLGCNPDHNPVEILVDCPRKNVPKNLEKGDRIEIFHKTENHSHKWGGENILKVKAEKIKKIFSEKRAKRREAVIPLVISSFLMNILSEILKTPSPLVIFSLLAVILLVYWWPSFLES